jgi:hypothetical protein
MEAGGVVMVAGVSVAGEFFRAGWDSHGFVSRHRCPARKPDVSGDRFVAHEFRAVTVLRVLTQQNPLT